MFAEQRLSPGEMRNAIERVKKGAKPPIPANVDVEVNDETGGMRVRGEGGDEVGNVLDELGYGR